MDWKTPFVIYRLTADAKLEEVYHASDLKTAKYWLTYIAQVGDVLCKTPLHPKHSGQSNRPEYWCHKESSGQPCSNEEKWKELAGKHNFSGDWPDKQSDTCHQPESLNPTVISS